MKKAIIIGATSGIGKGLAKLLADNNYKIGLRKKLSNSEMFINEAIEIARNIQYYWDSSDLETKLKLQKTVFPKGLWINPSSRGYLTRHVNYFFRRIPLFSRSLMWRKKKKVTVSGDFSSLVAGTGLSCTSLRMDHGEGFTKKSSDRYAFFLFSFQSTFESIQDYPSLRCGWTLGGLTRKTKSLRNFFFY
jgi:hypothetical protein